MRCFWVGCCLILLNFNIAGSASNDTDQPAFLGTVAISGSDRDFSNLNEVLEGGTPHNLLGAFGSGITRIGSGNRYLAVADRGPKDGAEAFKCRFHEFEITFDPRGKSASKVTLLRTVLLRNEQGKFFVGKSDAFDSENSSESLRFDPEGIAVSENGTIFIADEYGPFIYEFTSEGKRLRSMTIPSLFLIQTPQAAKKEEIAANKSGRCTNKGFEGLTLSPDKTKLYAILQGPLLQDYNKVCRLLEIDLKTHTTRQFAVPLSKQDYGFNEILSLNDHEFLVIERDDEKGSRAKFKMIVKIDIKEASDIQHLFSLPTDYQKSVRSVKKEAWLNLLDPKYGLAGASFPKKVEGLSWGPTLANGRRILIVTTDNDCKISDPNLFWFFSVCVSGK
jgi:hypothetical protein